MSIGGTDWRGVPLVALGDVISALSTNEKFIPYRNNKVAMSLCEAMSCRLLTLLSCS